jgi:hypothetical protein
MAHFASFAEPGFWLVMAGLFAVVLLAGRAYAPPAWRDRLPVAYWLLIPYLALLAGAVSPRLMGLYWLDWRATFQVGAGLLLATVLLALMGRLLTSPSAQPADDGGWPQRAARVRDAVVEEWFWCFLRAALWELLLAWPEAVPLPLYTAIWAAGALALPLTLLLQPNGAMRVIKTAALIVTSILFLYTRNFWLCALVHAALLLAFTPAVLHRRQIPVDERVSG